MRVSRALACRTASELGGYATAAVFGWLVARPEREASDNIPI